MATDTSSAGYEGKVELIQLGSGISPRQFEDGIRAAAPEMIGSLLSWTHDDWYALSPDVTPALWLAGRVPREVMEAAGAIGLRQIEARAFVDLLSLRDVQAGASSAKLRDRDVPPAVFVEPPTFARDGTYQGKPVKLDWHVAAADIPTAWEQLGAAGPGAYAGITVGHIDTGYTEHPALGFTTASGTWLRPDLGKNYWKDKADAPGTPEDPGRWMAAPEYPGPRDNLTGSFPGHGTRTAGLIAGLYAPVDRSLEYPFFGAAPGARVIPYRITDSVLIDHVPDLLARAIRDAVGQGAQVISISLGAARRSTRVAEAVDEAYRQGVIICAAAGQPLPWVVYPGRFNCVITVGGATTDDGLHLRPWRMSARGEAVEICGPADQVRRPSTTVSGGTERYVITAPGDGTSFATALCAGVAVLWLAKRSADLDAAYGSERWARVEAFRQLIRATAFVPPGWPTSTYGAGIYQAGALLRAALPPIAALQKQADA